MILYSVFGPFILSFFFFYFVLCHNFVCRGWRLINEKMSVLKEELEDKLNEEALAEGKSLQTTNNT